MKIKMTPVARRLVELIESDAEKLATNWLNDVKKNVKLPTYQDFDSKELYNRAHEVYSNLGKWIAGEIKQEEVAEQYLLHGAQRRRQKFELAEVIQALILMRVYLWRKVLTEGLLDTAIEFNQAIELNIQIVRYFDRAIYHTIAGYTKKNK